MTKTESKNNQNQEDVITVEEVKDWKNISSEFTGELQKEWEVRDFSYEECKEWIDAGLKVSDADYVQWLKDIKSKTVECFLNNEESQTLYKHYQTYSKNRSDAIEKMKSALAGYTEEEKDYFFGQVDKDLDKAFKIAILLRKITQVRKGDWVDENLLNDLLSEKDRNTTVYQILKNSHNNLVDNIIDESENLRDMKNKDHIKLEKDLIRENKEQIAINRSLMFAEECSECQQKVYDYDWCKACNYKHLQENNWTSGNPIVDDFIKKCQSETTDSWESFEWIPYKDFTNIEYLAEGGFGKVYKAVWTDGSIIKWSTENKKWERRSDETVVFKGLHNSQNITTEFLQEISNHRLFSFPYNTITKCHGISQDPNTKNYLMVMRHYSGGNLRQLLNNKSLNLAKKLLLLIEITEGLKDLHDVGLIHRDFHPGNILSEHFITDLGLSRPVNKVNDETIYGVWPYVAPELLRGGKSTQASDIYSWGMMAYELLANSFPYLELDGMDLYLQICLGYRPNLNELKIPKLLKELISRCWDANLSSRPTVNELEKTLNNWRGEIYRKENTEFTRQYLEIKEEYNHFSQTTPYKIHPTAVPTSKPINTKEIAQLFQESENQKKLFEKELKKIEKEINQPFTDELKELIGDFIQARKEVTKNEENEEAEDKAWELEDKLKEKGLSEKNIEKVMKYCERFVKAEQEQLNAQIEIQNK